VAHGSGAERACGVAWGYWHARVQHRVFCNGTGAAIRWLPTFPFSCRGAGSTTMCICSLRFEGGARGMLWASQVATGNENNLRLRAMERRRESSGGRRIRTICGLLRMGSRRLPLAALGPARHVREARKPHPVRASGRISGGVAQLYADLAEQIAARKAGRAPAPRRCWCRRGGRRCRGSVHFWVLESSLRNSAWVNLASSRWNANERLRRGGLKLWCVPRARVNERGQKKRKKASGWSRDRLVRWAGPIQAE